MTKNIPLVKKNLAEKINKFLKEVGEDIDLLYDFATKDEKTGLYNFRFFKSALELEINKYQRSRLNKNHKVFSLMIIDLDNFKKINTDYGHMTGDLLLVKFSEVLKETIRKTDTAARFGGEEFIILMPETSVMGARRLSERIRGAANKEYLLKKHELKFSAGIGEVKPSDTQSPLIKRVDKLLYKAKRNGKNRTEIIK